MHARAPGWRADGLVRRLVRGVLQLRAPKGVGRGKPDGSRMTSALGERGTAAPRVRFRDPQIEMAHGAGGKATRRLVDGLFAPLLFDGQPRQRNDAAIVRVPGHRIAVTTDSFVVTPLTFAGGSIGELAVNGTVNDLAVSGARPETIV